MRYWLEYIEETVDKLVIPSLIAVAAIVIAELFFKEMAYNFHTQIVIIDNIVISIFVIDVAFKLYRATNWEGFLREHWLEIIAIVPFFLVFRLLEGIFIAVNTIEKGQHVAHLAEGARSSRFAVYFRGPEVARSTKLGGLFRAISRSPRLAKAAKFFESPKHESIFK
jgi:hypothetical protein